MTEKHRLSMRMSEYLTLYKIKYPMYYNN